VTFEQKFDGCVGDAFRLTQDRVLQNNHSCVGACCAVSQAVHESIYGIQVDGTYVLSPNLIFVQPCDDDKFVSNLSWTNVDDGGKTQVMVDRVLRWPASSAVFQYASRAVQRGFKIPCLIPYAPQCA
jgi:hypothetical protein